MKVILKRDFIIPEFPRVKGGVEPVEIPAGTLLPADAVVVEETKKPVRKGRPRKVKREPEELELEIELEAENGAEASPQND